MPTVLIVEDDNSTRLLTLANLRRDFDVVSAEDGVRALEIVGSRHIDVIVSDIMMPGMDGYASRGDDSHALCPSPSAQLVGLYPFSLFHIRLFCFFSSYPRKVTPRL